MNSILSEPSFRLTNLYSNIDDIQQKWAIHSEHHINHVSTGSTIANKNEHLIHSLSFIHFKILKIMHAIILSILLIRWLYCTAVDSNLDSKTNDTLWFCVIRSEHQEGELSAKRTSEDSIGQLS